MTTVIACRPTGRMMSDSRVDHGDSSFVSRKKIERIGRFIVGVAGDYGPALAYRAQFAAAVKGKDLRSAPTMPAMAVEGFEMLVLSDRGLWVYSEDGTPIEIEEPFYAVGSGSCWALASLRTQELLLNGYDLALAMDVACEFDTQSSAPVVELTLG